MSLPEPFGHRLFVSRLYLVVELGIHRPNGDTHNSVRELVDKDVLAIVARTGITEKVFFGASRGIAAQTACAPVPILFVCHAANAPRLVVVRSLSGRQARIIG